MLYTPDVLNPKISLTDKVAVDFHWWLSDTFDVFSQHSAELAICCLGVRYECSGGGYLVGLGGSRCRL